MKLNQSIYILLFALAGGWPVFAQSNGAPGDSDYAAFSRFIAQRNIFDPNRYPHSGNYHRPVSTHHSAAAPLFTFVGAMSYDKGFFAFFSGNRDDLKKIVTNGGDIAGYSVTNISLTSVTLQMTNKPAITLNVGDQMRYEDNGWQYIQQGDAFGGVDAAGVSATTATNSAAAAASPVNVQTTAAPLVSSAAANDVLERLRKQREQEQAQ